LARNEKQLPEEREPVENGGAGPSRNGKSASNGVDRSPKEKTFVIYACDISDPKFLVYVNRMEEFLLWFVDAASFIDQQDEKWKFFVMYEKYKTSEGNDAYAFVGYSTVYNFFAYPANIRPRVSQMLILPPFQRQGLGVNLLRTIYTHYRGDTKVKEITVEDPSDDFELLRDYVDARDCMKLPSYSVENLKNGFSDKMLEETSKQLKMTKRQARRMFELLRLRSINVNNDKEFKEYRLDVKRRLNIPYQKQENDIKRMIRRKCNSVELQQAAQIDDASRKTELQSNFQNLYQHYQNIIHRLDKYDN
jgi:histone acetyltransferase 1